MDIINIAELSTENESLKNKLAPTAKNVWKNPKLTSSIKRDYEKEQLCWWQQWKISFLENLKCDFKW